MSPGSPFPRRGRTGLAVLVLLLSLLPASGAAQGPSGRIRHILIIHKDIFDTSLPEENKWPYRAVNKLHISTKDEVVLRELLLKEGDPYDPLLVKESERALRSILRLRQVRIAVIRLDDQTVDLLVEVHETWTTEPYVSLSGVGKDLSGKVGLRERNLLGRGKEGNFSYEKDAGVINRSFSYGDPNFFGSRLRLKVDYDDSEDGVVRAHEFGRPFYSSITPWSAITKGRAVDQEVRLYDDGREVQRYHQHSREGSLVYARSLGSTPRRIRRVGLGYRFLQDQLALEGPFPATLRERRHHILVTGLHLERVNFLTVDRIKRYDREEDFNLGPSAALEAGFARNGPDRSEAATFLKLDSFAGCRHGSSHFTLATLGGEGRFQDGRFQDSRPRLDVEYYNHFVPRQTLAVHLAGEFIARPEADSQIRLGGDNGLRGYQLNQFAGDKLLLANVENRFFLVDDILKVVGLGSVVFWDAGYAWDRGEAAGLEDIRMDVGTGLRFHISRSSLGHVLRLDVAYALTPVQGESRLVITFGSGQAF